LKHVPEYPVCKPNSPLLEADAWLYYGEGNVVISVLESNPGSAHGLGSRTSLVGM